MKQQLRFVAFRSSDDPGWREAWELYSASFPRCERWSEAAYARAFADPAFTADGVWLDGRLAGILFHWRGDGFRYVEHLAVSPAIRGGGLGSAILYAFCDRTERVVLEIDPPEDEISVRRLHFYRRLGFCDNPYVYVHPSYARPFRPHRLVLMSRPGPLSYDEARRFAAFIRERILLRYSDHAALPESLLK